MSLSGKTIIITGASSGIGETAAKQLARAGANVCLVARRAEELGRVQQQIVKQGGACWVYPADLTDAKSTDDCAATILREHKRIDFVAEHRSGLRIELPQISDSAETPICPENGGRTWESNPPDTRCASHRS